MSEPRKELLNHVATLEAAGFTVHGIHAPAESWMLCEDQRCVRIRAALRALDIALGADGPDHTEHFDPNCEECAYLARPTRETLFPSPAPTPAPETDLV